MKFLILLCAFCVLDTGVVSAEEQDDNATEQTTASPIGDMALEGDAIKTENQIVVKEAIKPFPGKAQTHTIADFIIHPLIALKPRTPQAGNVKQADGSSTTAPPWQFFGFNAGQGLGSSVSSLASSLGTVTGWLGNRIQLPSFVETPVRESSAITPSTTTVRPNVVVRIQQRPTTKRPLISINNENEHPIRRFNRPNQFNVVSYIGDSEESDDSREYNDYNNFVVKRKNHRRYQDYEDDDYGEQNLSLEHNDNDEDGEENAEADPESIEGGVEEDEDAEEVDARPLRPQNTPKRRIKPVTFNKIRTSYSPRKQLQRKHTLPQDESLEVEQYEDEDQDFYFNTNQQSKRSQSELNFLQRGQQNLLNQIKQLNKAQVPNKLPQAATLVIKRNGQSFFVAPELLQIPQINHNKVSDSANKLYSQTLLGMPSKSKGEPTQYITIPWNHFGISKPNEYTTLTDHAQSKPLILTLPQDVIEKIQKYGNRMPSLHMPAKKPTIAVARKTKVGATRIRPSAAVENTSPAHENKKDTDRNKSSESPEDYTHSGPILVIANDAANTKLSRSAYRQILDYFNRNRSGRQLNDEKSPISPIIAKADEIPVEIISAAEADNDGEIKTTTESPFAIESPVKEPETTEAGENKFVKP